MNRLYQAIIESHLRDFDQMVFLSGPRQSGKTTIARHIASSYNGMYLNWGVVADREKIRSWPKNLLSELNTHVGLRHKTHWSS